MGKDQEKSKTPVGAGAEKEYFTKRYFITTSAGLQTTGTVFSQVREIQSALEGLTVGKKNRAIIGRDDNCTKNTPTGRLKTPSAFKGGI